MAEGKAVNCSNLRWKSITLVGVGGGNIPKLADASYVSQDTDSLGESVSVFFTSMVRLQ
jgi:hypothetical protein